MDMVSCYLSYMRQNLSDEERWVLNVEPGTVILRGGSELFNHRHVALWHRFLVEYLPRFVKRVVLLLPCSKVKPYRESPTHRIAWSRISRAGARDKISILALSEPMILVPRELDTLYPFANYELPPQALDDEGRDLMAKLLRRALEALSRSVMIIVATLPRAHREVFERASRGLPIDIVLVPYGRKAFRSIGLASDIAIEMAKKFGR